MKSVSFQSTNNLKLAGAWHLPERPTNKAIILAHGLTATKDESGIFIDLAEALKNKGYAVFRFDFRGSGESEGKSVDMTITGELQDLDAAYDEVIQAGYKKLGLLGASFGGSVATFFVADFPEKFQSLCLWNPVIDYDHCFLNPITPWLKERKEHIKKDIDEKGWTAIGSSNFVLGRALFEEMASMFPQEAMKKIIIPVIVMHGDADKHVPYSDSVEYFPNLKGDAKFVTITGAEHGFHDSKEHSDKVIAATLEFFTEYL